MKAFSIEIGGLRMWTATEMKSNQYEIIRNALALYKEEMRTRISNDNERGIDFDRMLGKKFKSNGVSRAMAVIGEIEKMEKSLNDHQHVSALEIAKG